MMPKHPLSVREYRKRHSFLSLSLISSTLFQIAELGIFRQPGKLNSSDRTVSLLTYDDL
jgi:hypothetical protein